MPQLGLFLICVLIWGSTWIAISFQLGDIAPIVSVAYRFTLAAFMLGAFCLLTRRSLTLPLSIHLKMAAVGLFLYTLDYTLLYASQHYLVSAITAVMSASIIYLNVLFRRWFLDKPIRLEVVVGAALGLAGMAAIFLPAESASIRADGLVWPGVLLAAASFVFAALGNVVSERILDEKTPVVQMNFWAMSYGLVFMYGGALLTGADFALPQRSDYWMALVFLALFGSVLAFGAYMKLVQQIGSDKAAYVVLLYPLVALVISTVFEDYKWTMAAGFGVAAVLIGSGVAMGKIPLPIHRR